MARLEVCDSPGSAVASDPTATEALDVALIGYQDQGNLGMGYLAAVLQRARPHGRDDRHPRRPASRSPRGCCRAGRWSSGSR